MGNPWTTIFYYIIIFRPISDIVLRHYIYCKWDTKVDGQTLVLHQIDICTNVIPGYFTPNDLLDLIIDIQITFEFDIVSDV